jgi:lipopolysaccharide/colanic/teichoic acid biosynthesis glycosyltransferase
LGSSERALLAALELPEAEPRHSRVKRAFDRIAALLLLAACAPLLAAAYVLIRLTSPGPAFFVQRRIGQRCAEFRMYKLRTMRVGAEVEEGTLAAASPGTFLKIENDPRTTAVGRWLRRTSIDELPQLVNVLRGDMSLVGPRPLLVSDFAKFPRGEQLRRFSVLPGITGLWQISGRSRTSDEERIRLDCLYVADWSLKLDCRILLRTIPVVLGGRGAY